MDKIIIDALYRLACRIDYQDIYDIEMDNWDAIIEEEKEKLATKLIEAGWINFHKD
jgi:hypothetical protein